MGDANVEFGAYLEAICGDPPERYVQTDAEIALCLNVQTVPELMPQQGDQTDRAEKVERLPVLEGICKYAADHVLLSGKPGSGKSTALKQLLRQEAERTRRGDGNTIPVLVELRAGKPILDLIREVFRRNRLRVSDQQIDELLFDAKLLLLIDGVNEIASDELLRDLEEFRANNASTPMVFTTRDLGVRGNLGIAKKLEMQPLSEPQMNEFVSAYLPEQGAELLRQLQDRLRELGETPLLLKMLCDVFREAGQVPQNKGELFRWFDREYAQFKRIESISAELQRWKSELLQYLAFRMMQGNEGIQLQIVQTEAEIILEEFLKGRVDASADKAKLWLEDLIEHHLLQIAANRTQIEFHHQLFQEYYAAEYLLRQLDRLDGLTLKKLYLNPLDWTESLALMLGILDNEQQALRVVQLALEVDLKLGARLAVKVKPQFQQQIVEQVISLDVPELLRIVLLERTRCKVEVGRLYQALNDDDEDSDVRGSAALALSEIGSPEAVSALIQALNDEDSDGRRLAALALGKIGSPEAVAALIQALNDDDEDSDVQWSAALALGKIGSPDAIPALIQAFIKNKDSNGVFSIAYALVKIGSPETVPALIQTLNHEDSNVRWPSAMVLGEIGSLDAVPALIQALNHKDSDVRRSAAEALVKIGSPEAVTALIQALSHEDSDVRQSAAEALGKIGSPDAVFMLVQTIDDEDFDVRRNRKNTIKVLDEIGSPEAVTALLQALNHEYFDVRRLAAEALGEIGSLDAVPALIQALNDEDFNALRSAAEALVKIGSPEAVTALIQALNDEDSGVRWSAAEALGEIISPSDSINFRISGARGNREKVVDILSSGSSEAVPVLIQALNDESSRVRKNTIKILGEIGSLDAVPALIQELNDENSYVRRNAVRVLGKIGSLDAVPALIQALNDENSYVRENAVEVLSKIGSPEAVPALIQALSHEDSDVRENAVKVLGKIGSPEAVPVLIQALNDENSYVRENAAAALGEIANPQLLDQFRQLSRAGHKEVFSAISVIQERYRFYNYEIEQMALPAGSVERSQLALHFHGQVGQVFTDSVDIQGDNAGIQKNKENEQ